MRKKIEKLYPAECITMVNNLLNGHDLHFYPCDYGLDSLRVEGGHNISVLYFHNIISGKYNYFEYYAPVGTKDGKFVKVVKVIYDHLKQNINIDGKDHLLLYEYTSEITIDGYICYIQKAMCLGEFYDFSPARNIIKEIENYFYGEYWYKDGNNIVKQEISQSPNVKFIEINGVERTLSEFIILNRFIPIFKYVGKSKINNKYDYAYTVFYSKQRGEFICC